MEVKWLFLLSAVSILLSTAKSMETNIYVGEDYTWQCGGNEAAHWWLNGNSTGVIGNRFRLVNATVDDEGTLTCTTSDEAGSHAIVTTVIRIYSIFGVTPSPLNCSSTDGTTNTCIVSTSANSSLTLCADFTYYPSDAQNHAPVIGNSVWKQLQGTGNPIVWYCTQINETNCLRFNAERTPSSTVDGDWGRCLHLDKVTQNTSFNYAVVVSPWKAYPAPFADKFARNMTFNVKVGPRPTPTSTSTSSPTSTSTSSPTSTSTSSPTSASTSSPTTTSTSTPTSATDGPPVTGMALEEVVTIVTAVMLLLAIIIVSILSMVLYRCGYCRMLQRKIKGNFLTPKTQVMEGDGKRNIPKTLPIAPYAITVEYKSASSTTNLLSKPLIGETPNTDDGSICSSSPFTPNVLRVVISGATERTPPRSPPLSLLPPPPQMMSHLKVNDQQDENKSVKSLDFIGGLDDSEEIRV